MPGKYIQKKRAGVILQFVAALLGTCLAILTHRGRGGKMDYDRDGIRWSTMAGLAVGLAEMLSFCVSGLGVPATQSIPVIIGGSVMFGAVLGMILLGEELLFHGWSGIALLVTGIVFVALDPGEKVEEGGLKMGGSTSSSTEEIIVVGGFGHPPMYWILIALICASAYAFYNIFIKKGSASISPVLGGKRLNLYCIVPFVGANPRMILSPSLVCSQKRRCAPICSGNLRHDPTRSNRTQGWRNVQSKLRLCRSILVGFVWHSRRISRNAQFLRLRHGCECHAEYSSNHWWVRPRGCDSWIVPAWRNHVVAWLGRYWTINCRDRICGN